MGEEQEIDLSGYTVKYVKCQFVKSYDDELAEDEEAGTVLATNRFIIFRLCPSESCTYNYGEYLVDMDAYLESAVEYHQEQQEVSCDTCVDECNDIANMEDNGYVDASNFVQCQQIAEQDDGTAYYAGAMCANSGAKIKIGVFSDEDCSQPESGLSVADYVGAKLSTSLMRNIYS